MLRQAGLEVVLPPASPADLSDPLTGARYGPFPYLAGTDAWQAGHFAEIMRSGADFAWCLRGGYGIIRWMHLVQWETVREKTRPVLVGFSDATFLHAALNRSGCVSLHAPLVTTLADTASLARESLWEALRTGRLPTLHGSPLVRGRAAGPLVGGNLTCLAHLIGTPFEPVWEGAILLIEDRNEALYRLDRILTHLRLSGRLSKIAGVAAGHFLDTKASNDLVLDLLIDRLGDLAVPVVTDLPVGHGRENFPVLLGRRYELDGDAGTIRPEGALPVALRR